jgi:Arc/MetJ-type ribon-helix-helix transcriptional regulator
MHIFKKPYLLGTTGDIMDEIIHVRISEEERRVIDQLIKEGKFKNQDELISESIRHYLFTIIEEKMEAVRAQSKMNIEEITESVRESRNRIFQEIFSNESLFG